MIKIAFGQVGVASGGEGDFVVRIQPETVGIVRYGTVVVTFGLIGVAALAVSDPLSIIRQAAFECLVGVRYGPVVVVPLVVDVRPVEQRANSFGSIRIASV